MHRCYARARRCRRANFSEAEPRGPGAMGRRPGPRGRHLFYARGAACRRGRSATPVPLGPGLTALFAYAVRDDDTAAAVGSGDVAVLATPRVAALAERATCAAVAGHTTGDLTTVGTRVELDHLVPTPVGATVSV